MTVSVTYKLVPVIKILHGSCSHPRHFMTEFYHCTHEKKYILEWLISKGVPFNQKKILFLFLPLCYLNDQKLLSVYPRISSFLILYLTTPD